MLRYRAGLLTAAEVAAVPRSTRFDWIRRDTGRIYGMDVSDPFFEPDSLRMVHDVFSVPVFRRVIAALYRVHRFYRTVLNTTRDGRALLKKQKKKIVCLVNQVAPALGRKRSCTLFGISRATLGRWRDETVCLSSPFDLCRRVFPSQLTVAEQKIVHAYLTHPEYTQWPLISRYLRMLRDAAAFMHPATFYKYARRFGVIRRGRLKPARRVGWRAQAPFEVLHMDSTRFMCADGIRLWIHVIRDNFSRALLGFRIGLSASSELAVANLTDVCTRFGLFRRGVTLLCDDGPENAGQIAVFLERADVRMTKVIAQLHVSFSNSMAEDMNKIIKHQGLFPACPRSPADVQRVLEQFKDEFNNRPLAVLHGLSPNEVLAGKEPDRFLFSPAIERAARSRVLVNRSVSCGVC